MSERDEPVALSYFKYSGLHRWTEYSGHVRL